MEHVWRSVFNPGTSIDSNENLIEEWETGYVAEHGGKLVGGFIVYSMTTRGGLRNAGVAAVAILPEHRHRGIGREMMRWALGK